MRIHLSARHARREEIAQVAVRLEGLGHEVTSRWISGRARPLGVNGQFDLTDVAVADAIVVFGDDPRARQGSSSRGGRHVEFGYALKANKRLFRVGEPENVFHELERVRPFDDIDKLVRHFAFIDLLDDGGTR